MLTVKTETIMQKEAYEVNQPGRYSANDDGFIGIALTLDDAKKIIDQNWYHLSDHERKKYGSEYCVTSFMVPASWDEKRIRYSDEFVDLEDDKIVREIIVTVE